MAFRASRTAVCEGKLFFLFSLSRVLTQAGEAKRKIYEFIQIAWKLQVIQDNLGCFRFLLATRKATQSTPQQHQCAELPRVQLISIFFSFIVTTLPRDFHDFPIFLLLFVFKHSFIHTLFLFFGAFPLRSQNDSIARLRIKVLISAPISFLPSTRKTFSSLRFSLSDVDDFRDFFFLLALLCATTLYCWAAEENPSDLWHWIYWTGCYWVCQYSALAKNISTLSLSRNTEIFLFSFFPCDMKSFRTFSEGAFGCSRCYSLSSLSLSFSHENQLETLTQSTAAQSAASKGKIFPLFHRESMWIPHVLWVGETRGCSMCTNWKAKCVEEAKLKPWTIFSFFSQWKFRWGRRMGGGFITETRDTKGKLWMKLFFLSLSCCCWLAHEQATGLLCSSFSSFQLLLLWKIT